MQKIVLTFIILLLLTNVNGQKTAFGFSLNSGLFSFSGQSAQNTSFINFHNATNSGYTNNPYGSKVALGYGLSGTVKRVTKKNLVLGLDLGYETLRSKIMIDGISGYTGSSTYEYDADGKTFLNYNFINLFPSIGYRLGSKKVSFDFTGGVDIAYCLKTTEHGKAEASDGITYKTRFDRKTIKTDFRPRVQISANYKHTGIYVGYAYGFVNYKSGYVGGTNECYAKLIRFGLTYQF